MSKGTTTATADINPDLLEMYKEVYASAKSAADLDFLPYEGDLVAGFNPDQLASFDQVRGMFGESMAYDPRGALAALATDPLDISAYANPYQTQVIDAAIGDLGRSRQIQQIEAGDKAVAASAFGGARHGILESEADRAYFDAVGRTTAGLRHQGFETAAELGMSDREYRTAIQQGLLGDQYQTLGLLGGIGGQQEAKQQAQYDAAYGQYGRVFDYPARQLGLLLSGIRNLPPAVGETVKQGTGAGDYLSALSGLLGISMQSGMWGNTGSGSASDIRLKENIKYIGQTNGLNIYEYNYIWSKDKYRGVMAQELLDVKPEAVSVSMNGYYLVDYSQLDVNLERAP